MYGCDEIICCAFVERRDYARFLDRRILISRHVFGLRRNPIVMIAVKKPLHSRWSSLFLVQSEPNAPCLQKQRRGWNGYQETSFRRRFDVRTTVERDFMTTKAEEASSYDWFKQWWPAQLVRNLETDRPNRVHLLGEYYAVWKNKEGEWIAMKDSCPHKLAPLSEGKRMFLTM